MRKIIHPVVLLAVFSVLGGSAAATDKDGLEVSVIGQTAPTYKRKKLPDGTFKPEGYAITNGGILPGTSRDTSVEKVPFPAMADVVGRHLAKQNYFLAEKPADFNLLIVMHWGMTNGFESFESSHAIARSGQSAGAVKLTTEQLGNLQRDYSEMELGDPQKADQRDSETKGKIQDHIEVLQKDKQRAIDSLEMSAATANIEDQARDRANVENAKVLGYIDAINARRNLMPSRASDADRDLMQDVEEKRYFVVLTAYDFGGIKERKKVPLWVTRISIRATGNSFGERMAQMIASAANTYGKKVDLKRTYYGDPRVELGEVEYLGVAAPASPPLAEKSGK